MTFFRLSTRLVFLEKGYSIEIGLFQPCTVNLKRRKKNVADILEDCDMVSMLKNMGEVTRDSFSVKMFSQRSEADVTAEGCSE